MSWDILLLSPWLVIFYIMCDFYRTLRMSFFVATTIGRANMMAILEVEENEEAQKGRGQT